VSEARLTLKQQRFVDLYLLLSNATQAAIEAGYSARTARSIGQENLTKPAIAAAVESARSEQAERTQIDADWVVQKLGANVDMAMQAVPVYRDGKRTGEYVYEGAVANRALELLGKHFRMFPSERSLLGDLPNTGGPVEITVRYGTAAPERTLPSNDFAVEED